MISIVDRYFSINRTLLLIIGLWPYEKSKFVGLQIICIFSTFIISLIFLFTIILTSICSTEDIIKVLSIALPLICCVTKYNSFYINSEMIKVLMNQIQHVYNDLRDSNEIAIIDKYGNNAKQYTVVFTMFLICSIPILMGPFLLELIDIVLSTNISRSYHLQICTEYFIDERYFYLLFFHATATIGSIALLVTESLILVYFRHACGMFKIASYRIEKAIHINTLKDLDTQKEILIYKDLICAVDIHRKSMTFSTYLTSRFQILYMFLIIFGVLSLSLNILRIFQIVLLEYNTGELLLCFAIVSFCFLYMFICNLIGQQIMDHNNDIFLTAYKVQWYVTPLFIQRLILILLQRGSKSFHMKAGGLFVASLECFATLINASLSYFVVMYSMQS